MKKTYQKPGIYIESFMMSQSVANGCEMGYGSFEGTNSGSPQTCALQYGTDIMLFVTGNGSPCDLDGEPGSITVECYQNLEADLVLINS